MQRFLLTLFQAVLVIVLSGWGVSVYAACPPFPGTSASTEDINEWSAKCKADSALKTSAGSANSCQQRDENGNPTLAIWGYPPVYNYEKSLRQGVSLICPTDDGGTSEDETNRYWTDGLIRVRYTPCNTVPVVDNSQPSGYRCDGGTKPAQDVALAAGSCETMQDIDFCAEKVNNMLCAYVSNGLEKVTIGCHGDNPHITPINVSLACFIPTVCTSDTTSYSHNPFGFSLSGTLVMCFEGAMDMLFFGGNKAILGDEVTLDYYTGSDIENFYSEASCSGSTMFTRIQSAFKEAVTAALILYVIFWGIKVSISGQPTTRGEFIKNVITYVLVVYFTLGNGWEEYYPLLRNLIVGFSTQVLRGNLAAYGGTNNPCIFSVNDYPTGMGAMALWDMLDCKVINYIFSGKDWPKLVLLGVLAIFNWPMGILLVIFIVMFILFITLMFFYTLQIYLISMITIAMLMLISPVIIPMVLFGPTKGYFGKWLSELISVSLYPIVLLGFIAIMLTTFDRFYYGDPDGTKTVYCSGCSGHLFTSCDQESFGCQLDMADIDGVDIDNFDFDTAFLQLIRVCLFAFLFFKFTEILPAFLAELTGSAKTNLGDMSISPREMLSS